MEFQPVIMAAGHGGRLAPLSDKIAKCLLTIGNIPMLWYPLRSLDLAGFKDVIIIVLKSWENRVANALDNMQKKVSWKTDGFSYKLHVVNDNVSEDEGTALSLFKATKTGKKDLLVISCDLITNIPLKMLIDKHSLHQATLTSLMKIQTKPEGAIPGVKSKSIAKENNIAGIDKEDGRLMFIFAEADHEDFIPLSQTMLERHPRMDLSCQLEDCHLYCISRAAITNDHIQNHQFNSLQSELVPYLISQQFKEHKNMESEDEGLDAKLSMDLVTKLSSWTDHTGDMDGPYHDTKIKCYVHFADQDQLCLRTNTTADYYEANKQIAAYSKHFGLVDYHKLPEGLKRSQAGFDSMISERLQLGEKSSIKKSIIGTNCEIGARVKINNSIIMDNVKIRDGSVIQTCIICDNSTIEKSSELKECIIGSKQTVESGKLTNEVIADDDDEFQDI